MFQDLYLLPIYELANFNTSLFMHKAYYENLQCLQCYFKKVARIVSMKLDNILL